MTCGRPYDAAQVDGARNGRMSASARAAGAAAGTSRHAIHARLHGPGRRAPRRGRRPGGHGGRHDARRRQLVAGRAPARRQSVFLESWPLVSYMKRYPVLKLPVLRGVTALVESLVVGVRALTISANQSIGEEGEELTKREIGITLVVALGFAIGAVLSGPAGHHAPVQGTARHRLVVLAGRGSGAGRHLRDLPAVITRFRDLRRVFEYHGAEHKSIHALEHGDELTVANVDKYNTLHLRCGTSFLLDRDGRLHPRVRGRALAGVVSAHPVARRAGAADRRRLATRSSASPGATRLTRWCA